MVDTPRELFDLCKNDLYPIIILDPGYRTVNTSKGKRYVVNGRISDDNVFWEAWKKQHNQFKNAGFSPAKKGSYWYVRVWVDPDSFPIDYERSPLRVTIRTLQAIKRIIYMGIGVKRMTKADVKKVEAFKAEAKTLRMNAVGKDADAKKLGTRLRTRRSEASDRSRSSRSSL